MKTLPILSVILTGVSLLAHDRPQPTFRADSQLVVLHVSVRDGGRYVTDLPQEAFTVIDNGSAQAINMFSSDDVPASIVFLIDNSNSMRPSRDRVIAAASAFARNAHPQDEIVVLTFNEQVSHAFGPTLASDIDPSTFERAVDRAIVARGMTAIYDGIAAGLTRLEHARHTRQVLIVISDGDDNASRTRLDDVLKQVRESDATVYTIALIDPLIRDGNLGLLRRLAKETGGESFEPRRVDEMPKAFERIAKDIRSAYTLAWSPSSAAAGASERRRHTVRVYVRGQNGHSFRVRARDGYFEKRGELQ